MLTVQTSIPPDFLTMKATQAKDVLGGPTLFLLEGRRTPFLFVSILLHGNETTGLKAVQRLLPRYTSGELLPRSLALFVGNVDAAAQGLRRLDHQPDYNRIWPGSAPNGLPEQDLVRQVFDVMESRGVFASVDIHNNTGRNPNYAAIAELDDRTLQLAILFGRTVVHFLDPTGYQCKAFGELGPSVTLECGLPGAEHGVHHAHEYLDACLHLSEIPGHPPAHHDFDLFETRAMVSIRDTVRFGFDNNSDDLVLREDIDQLNFLELECGTHFATLNDGDVFFAVDDGSGEDATRKYFEVENGDIRLTRPAMPSMLTRDLRIIKQDCLCYLMERVPLQASVGD